MITLFQVKDKDGMSCFFEETFLLADNNRDIAFGIPFLTLNNVEVNINDWELKWKLYTATKALLTTRRMELVEKKEFTTIAFDLKNKAFVVYIASLTSSDNVYPSCKVYIASLLKVDKFSTIILLQYFDFVDISLWN